MKCPSKFDSFHTAHFCEYSKIPIPVIKIRNKKRTHIIWCGFFLYDLRILFPAPGCCFGLP